ncbi:MarR family winged helix-turn-helix transcriptional regulator [Propionivibrio limicola]|uniref:MarR family winged helix-turn-helix transcriptional regulator n=1 Tax=Propionivibrio limicola TaxID=167645 RepID=UPI001292A280|nr:MarR family winged helix-turn-helix transcriptional regulator [Propionivibrio limicola]
MNAALSSQLNLEIVQQFRIIYGSMRQYFREVEESCGLPGSQMWVLQEAQRTPGLGITELAGRMGIHQSTCSLLVDKLVTRGYLTKARQGKDHRRVGITLTENGEKAIAALPGPAEGILPEALATMPLVALNTLNTHLSELIQHLPGHVEGYARTPLADMLQNRRDPAQKNELQ